MQYLAELRDLELKIREVISISDYSTTLKNCAFFIGELFKVEGCAVVCVEGKSAKVSDIGWWGKEHLGVLETNLLSCFDRDLLYPEYLETGNNNRSFVCHERNNLSDLLKDLTSLVIITSFQNKVNGAILLVKQKPYQWTNSERQLLEQISNSMAIAISQVQLQREAVTKTRYQKLLNRLSREISQSSEINSILNLCLSETGKILELDRGTVLILKYQDPLFAKRVQKKNIKGTARISDRWSKELVDNDSEFKSIFQITDLAWCQEAIEKAPQPLVVKERDETIDPFFKDNNDSTELLSSSAFVIMPLMGKITDNSNSGLVLGFLIFESDNPRSWTDDELDLIDWISVQMSTALIHHQTLNQVQSLVEERTSQLQWSLDVQAKLSEKMRLQIERLRELNELKDDFLSSMSHELKTPMTSMKMAIKMLKEEKLPDSMRAKYLDILEQEWNREYNLIKDLLALQKAESGELTFAPQELNISQIFQPLSDTFLQKWQSQKGLTLETNVSDRNLTIYSDSDSLNQILTEMLLNAGKYSHSNTTVSLFVTFELETITIICSNYGTGITSEEIPHIFDKFRRGKGVTDRAVPGTGLGLALVKYLVEHINGTIEVTSDFIPDSDMFKTSFILKLPRFQKT